MIFKIEITAHKRPRFGVVRSYCYNYHFGDMTKDICIKLGFIKFVLTYRDNTVCAPKPYVQERTPFDIMMADLDGRDL